MFDWIKRNRNKIIIVVTIALMGVPFLIHCLFKIDGGDSFWSAEWTSGDVLSFYGSVLSFCATVILSILALWQNEIIREESNKHTQLLEEMEKSKSCPFFTANCLSEKISHSDISIEIKNITENIAQNIEIEELNSTFNRLEKFHMTYSILAPNASLVVELGNGFLDEIKLLQFSIRCKDIYGNINCFLVQGKYDPRVLNYTFNVIKA